MEHGTIASLLDPTLDLARKAGAAILDIACEDIGVETKDDGSPLTRADRASHEILCDGLSALMSEVAILSEEGDLPADHFAGSPVFWLIDPLDGTKEFINGLTEYTVNVALVIDARPVLGVVVAPALRSAWYAAEGAGAWRQVGDAPAERIACSTATRPVSAVVSRSHCSPETLDFLKANNIDPANSISKGSSVKLCAVADGSADVYPRLGPTNLWDTGAAAAVAREAGCRVTDLTGEDLSYDPTGGTLREGFLVFPRGMHIQWPLKNGAPII